MDRPSARGQFALKTTACAFIKVIAWPPQFTAAVLAERRPPPRHGGNLPYRISVQYTCVHSQKQARTEMHECQPFPKDACTAVHARTLLGRRPKAVEAEPEGSAADPPSTR